MCGIAGSYGDTREHILRGMLDRIKHRGPDDVGMHIEGSCMLGSVRLSIIDVSGGHQPLSDPAGRHTIAYNGEIYGYQELRTALERRGWSFRTHTDTEVLLAQYVCSGLSGVADLNGMFAFAVYDNQHDDLLIVRDPVGVKPLLYAVVDNRLYFCSEAKALYAVPEWQPKPDWDAWHTFLNIRFTPPTQTLFDGVRKIPPGCCLHVSCKGGRTLKGGNLHSLEHREFGQYQAGLYRYCPHPYATQAAPLSDPISRLRGTLEAVVADQLVADVDVGVYLSGGLDSSAIAATAARVRTPVPLTFCLAFGEPSDENADARKVANAIGAQHRDVRLSDSPLDHYRRAVYHAEEPKVNCLQSYLLAREARRFGKVMLSGLGGDELFGGYDIYAIAAYLDCVRGSLVDVVAALARGGRLGLAAVPGFVADNLRRGTDAVARLRSPLDVYLILRNSWDHDTRLSRRIYRSDLLNRGARHVRDHFIDRFPQCASLAGAFMRFELEHKTVDDFLSNEDRMSMAHGVEVRVPLLDQRMVRLAAGLPLRLKIVRGQRKVALRKAMAGSLPPSILAKQKHGFTFDPVHLFARNLRGFAAAYLTRERVEDGRLFRYKFVQSVLNSRPSAAMRWHYFMLWQMAGYHVWEDIFIRNRGTV